MKILRLSHFSFDLSWNQEKMCAEKTSMRFLSGGMFKKKMYYLFYFFF